MIETNFKHTEIGLIPHDWEVKTLADVGTIRMCRRIMKYQTSDSGDIPFYKIGTFGKQADAYISKELYNEFRSKYNYPKKGDILLSAAGILIEEQYYTRYGKADWNIFTILGGSRSFQFKGRTLRVKSQNVFRAYDIAYPDYDFECTLLRSRKVWRREKKD